MLTVQQVKRYGADVYDDRITLFFIERQRIGGDSLNGSVFLRDDKEHYGVRVEYGVLVCNHERYSLSALDAVLDVCHNVPDAVFTQRP